MQKAVSATIVRQHLDYWTGTVYTTNRRVWEHDDKFKEYLQANRIMGIDMETATIFVVGFVNHIPKGTVWNGPDDWPRLVKDAMSLAQRNLTRCR